MNITEKGGGIVSSHVVCAEDRALVLTEKGIALRLRLSDIRQSIGRSTQGVRLIKLDEGDSVSSVAIVSKKTEEEEESE